MADYRALIPLNIVTGFLGSGKTTLLQGLLRQPELANVAVLVNEFGEIGLDHQLLQAVTESTLLLDNGCVCCAIRGDLQAALRELYGQRERGAVPAFERVIIETSGLADPVPIAYTLLAEPVLRHHFRLGAIVATVDAVNGAGQLASFEESRKQAAVADRLIVTKRDLVDAAAIDALEQALRALNRSAPIRLAGPDMADARLLLDDVYDPNGRGREVAGWLEASGDEMAHGHSEDVTSFTISHDDPLDWTAFGIWLSMLLNRHGEKVLRVKGLLNVIDVPTPLLINGVQHIVHPSSHLDRWPDDDRRSRLIFIVRGLDPAAIRHSLAVFNRLSNARAAA